MINVNTDLSPQLLNEIEQYVRHNVIPNVRLFSRQIPENDRNIFNELFSDENIISLINSSPTELEDIANNIYMRLPQLAERYHPYRHYSRINEDLTTIENINVRGNEELISVKATAVLNEINIINRTLPASSFNYVSNSLSARTLGEKLDALKRVQSFKRSRYKITQHDINKLSPWLSSPFDMFDYDSFRNLFNEKIIESYNLTPCPFCAYDSVEIVRSARKTYIPALDHFLPKSKYPFLALSINNLLPSCHRCNSSFKKEADMLEHFHPKRDSVEQIDVFQFSVLPDTPFSSPEPSRMTVGINSNCPKLLKNSVIFELEGVYNLKNIKKKFLDMRERIELYKSMGGTYIDDILSDPEKIRLLLNVDLNARPQDSPLQKFKIEALNSLRP